MLIFGKPPFCTNVLEGFKSEKNIHFLKKPSISIECLELTCPIFIFVPSNTLLLMTYFEQYDSFSMQDTQQYYAIKYDRFLRKKLCPWDKNQLNVFFNFTYGTINRII